MLPGVEDTNSDSDIEIEELCGGERVKPQSRGTEFDGTRGACQGGGGGGLLQKSKNERFHDQVTSSKDVTRHSQRCNMQCNCGHKGPIASHLRTNQQCVQGIRDELSLGVEISDESLIIQTTLVLRGCPAVGCAGGNHDEIPMDCMSWWQESGWNVMQWEETGEDLTSTVIKQKCKQFVMDLMQQNDDGRQETAPDNKNAADRIQTDGNMEEKSMTELDNVFLPPITSTQKDTTNARREGGKRPAANVSKKLGFLIEPGSMWTLVHVGPE